MKIYWSYLILFSTLLWTGCGNNEKDVPASLSFENNPSTLTPEAQRQPIPSMGAPRPFEGQPAQTQPAPGEPQKLDCNYEVIKKNFRSDPKFPEILDAVVGFEEYQDNIETKKLADIVGEFNQIYADSARFHKPCSEDYMKFYRGKGMVEEYAERMCEQMLLSQYFNAKFPCLRQLTSEQQTELILGQ